MRFDFLVPIFMASPAYPSMAFASTKETTNYARLCRLLVDVGSQALRDTFDKIHPPASLHGVLASRSVYSTLQLLRKRRILNATRWGKLYPAIPLSVSSADFDITLLILLLRNICGLPPPATGWDNLPSAKDTSIEADIARIKYYRNNVYGHASMASVDDRTFNVLWQKISNALVALGGASYGAPINKLKTDSMDPDIEEHYQELLKEWKKDDESTKDKLEGLEDKIEHMLSGMEREIISAFTEMYADLSYNIGNVLEEMKEIKYNLAASAAETLNKVSGDSDPTKTINQIHQLYTSREGWLAPFPWCEEFHFHLNDIFTRLVMVSREKKGRGTATRNVVDMSTIFQPHEECPEPKKVLIEGKPGMGKTTYCNKIAYDWATGKRKEGDCFPDFELVLSLKCRDISIESNLWGAIDDQLLPREIQEDEREKFFKFIRQNQSNVLLVLDGLDELHTSKLPEFSEIIQGRLLPGCHLVVTARHEAGIPVRKVFDTLLEIEGFTEEDAKEFILKYFKAKENLAEKLLHQLENDENLQEMVANPLSTAILCLLCEDFQGIPEPRTLLYLEVVECVLRRYNKKNGLPVPDSEDLTEVYKGPLKHLGSVALNGLREGNMYFDGQQLGNYTTVIPGFGLLSVQPGSSKRRPCLCYGFLHKSFQELFAAFYICCQLLSKEISPGKLVADTRYFRELKPVLLFTCGILARQSEETAVALITSITEVNEVEDIAGTVVLECIKECKKEHSSFHGKLALIYLKDKNIALTPQQRYELQLMAGQRAVEQGPDKTKLHEEILTSEGTDWDLKVGAVHLRFPPNAVSEPTSIVVHKWKYGACSPPLQEHEAIVSNVIEISTITGQALEFNVEVKLFLSHSAPDLQGYEVVVKKQIDKESNEWEDVDGTEDLKCLQGIKDDIPPHKDILDMFFPVARVNITKCSTYAVVCRLKSSPPYTITSTGGSFSHPDYPGVTVTIPENAVAPEAKFPLELKVQEVLSEDFEGKDVFIGPILRISCSQVVQFLKPVTIQLPASLRDEEREIPDPSTCRVRVFFLRSDGEHKEWIEITSDLAKPAMFDGKFVMFQVERFSGYWSWLFFGRHSENVSVTGNESDLLSRINYTPILVYFFAYFRPDSQEILLLLCCPSHLRGGVIQELERKYIEPSEGSSKKKMIPGRDEKIFVFVSGGIEAFSTEDMEDVYLLLDHSSPSKLELRVRLVSDRDMAQVEFRSKPKPERSIVLCKLYPPISTPRVQDMASDGRTRQHVAVKDGCPSKDELDGLSQQILDNWKELGRRLIDEARLIGFDNDFKKCSEKAYAMLKAWKETYSSEATYQVLFEALCHSLVNRRDLAKEFCCHSGQ